MPKVKAVKDALTGADRLWLFKTPRVGGGVFFAQTLGFSYITALQQWLT